WKSVQNGNKKEQDKRRRLRRKKIVRITKTIKEVFQCEQEKLTKEFHEWKRRRIEELQKE
ncbi:6956_t:CDS:1, partial [Paraglomus occultum]